MDLTLPDPERYQVVALDLGTAYTGLSIWKRGELSLFQEVITSAEHSSSEAAAEMFSAIADITERHLDRKEPVLCVCEDYAYGSGFFNVIQAELVGFLKRHAIENCWIGIVFVAPNTIKRLVTGSGRATKSQVKKAVLKLIGIKISSTHIVDSLAAFIAYRQIWSCPTEGMYRRAFLLAKIL